MWRDESIVRIDSGLLFSEAVNFGGVLHLSGQVAVDSAGQPFDVQIGEILSRIDTLLVRGESSRNRLLSAMVHLTSREHLDNLNRAWAEWLPAGEAPARTTVIAPLVAPEFLVEITVTAAILGEKKHG